MLSGNTGLDPAFVDRYGPDTIAGNEDDDLRLTAGSPRVDAGDPLATPAGKDLAGNPRFLDRVDGIVRCSLDLGKSTRQHRAHCRVETDYTTH